MSAQGEEVDLKEGKVGCMETRLKDPLGLALWDGRGDASPRVFPHYLMTERFNLIMSRIISRCHNSAWCCL